MDNKGFTAAMAQQMGCDTEQVARLVSGFASILKRECADLNRIAIPGFGAFEGVKRDEEVRRDLVSGAAVLYPPCIETEFTAGVMLKKTLRENR